MPTDLPTVADTDAMISADQKSALRLEAEQHRGKYIDVMMEVEAATIIGLLDEIAQAYAHSRTLEAAAIKERDRAIAAEMRLRRGGR